jgi:hypothetical protein
MFKIKPQLVDMYNGEFAKFEKIKKLMFKFGVSNPELQDKLSVELQKLLHAVSIHNANEVMPQIHNLQKSLIQQIKQVSTIQEEPIKEKLLSETDDVSDSGVSEGVSEEDEVSEATLEPHIQEEFPPMSELPPPIEQDVN